MKLFKENDLLRLRMHVETRGLSSLAYASEYLEILEEEGEDGEDDESEHHSEHGHGHGHAHGDHDHDGAVSVAESGKTSKSKTRKDPNAIDAVELRKEYEAALKRYAVFGDRYPAAALYRSMKLSERARELASGAGSQSSKPTIPTNLEELETVVDNEIAASSANNLSHATLLGVYLKTDNRKADRDVIVKKRRAIFETAGLDESYVNSLKDEEVLKWYQTDAKSLQDGSGGGMPAKLKQYWSNVEEAHSILSTAAGEDPSFSNTKLGDGQGFVDLSKLPLLTHDQELVQTWKLQCQAADKMIVSQTLPDDCDTYADLVNGESLTKFEDWKAKIERVKKGMKKIMGKRGEMVGGKGNQEPVEVQTWRPPRWMSK